MGQKANLNGSHLSSSKDWNSIWYLPLIEYSRILHEDLLLYRFLRSLKIYKKLNKDSRVLSVVKIRICRVVNVLLVELFFSFELRLKRIKRKRFFIQKWNNWKNKRISIIRNLVGANIFSFLHKQKHVYIVTYRMKVFNLKSEANFIAQKLGFFIEHRVKFRSRLIKKILFEIKKICSGVFVICSGRLNGVDMARSDFLFQGAVPFQSLDKNVSYGVTIANTAKGLQSIKVSIYK